MLRPVSRRVAALLTAGLTMAVALPLGVLASHQFADVPDSNTFHNDISAIADAGVTTGCGGGNYCPKAYVTREQMAAFLNRLGALGPGKTPVANATKLDGLDSTQFARSDVDVAGSYSCPAEGIRPKASTVAWSIDGSNGIESGTDAADLVCPVTLPDGAELIAVDFLVRDASMTDDVLNCFMYARAFEQGTLGMSGFGTGSTSGTPGVTTLTWDFEPGTEFIDNHAHSYFAGCTLDASTDTSIVEIEVRYSTTGNLVH